MNRQQRRAAQRSGAKPPPGSGSEAASADAIAGLFNAALACHQTGALTEAEQRYRHILERNPRHADSLHNLGLIALQADNAAAAAELIGKAIAVNDRVAEYHYNIALAWRAQNRMDDVATHLERAIALRGDYALAHLNLGNVRREHGRLADAIACYERAIALAPSSAAARFNLANMLSEQGRWDAAIAQYTQALAIEPNHAEAHGNLGTALFTAGRTGDAVSHLERAAALMPDRFEVHEILGKAYMASGDVKSAILAAGRALELKETLPGKTFFAQCLRYGRFTADNGRFRQLSLRALAEGWTHPRDLVAVCISLIALNGAIVECVARANRAWPARLAAAELFGASGLDALAQDELLRCLLECAPLTEVGFERLLANIRSVMLTAAEAGGACDERVLGFYCAAARQCYDNDYVYSLADGEADRAQRMRASLEQALVAGRPCSPLWPIAVGAYFPLRTLANAEALLARSWPESVNALLVQQIKEPAEERRLAAAMPALTGIDSEVSRSVRQQYEENPYPRWVKVALPAKHTLLADRKPAQSPDVLIAGCGTGLSTVTFAQEAPDARILAIDLSLASLGYAKRMALSLGFRNIEFAQADITKLDSLGRTFDFIDVSGVLHHLADPWQGWRVLLSLLRPGGVMQVGLYSKLARRNVVAARALIAERGYRATPEDIRRCREEIVAAEDGSLLKSAATFSDFFTTNECRDLLFHVQEHQMTLPEIKAFLAASGVQFTGFVLDPSTQQRFAARFPEASALTDLDRWHAFETEAPATFSAMYQFFVRKL
jgi:tetratricopeptide (TPR) repeat protein/2-polyprenyl-3-methyl-5-hydroxy-6-metoxy-1,4-benzoquinol methylase